jgi:hypothetical protein
MSPPPNYNPTTPLRLGDWSLYEVARKLGRKPTA